MVYLGVKYLEYNEIADIAETFLAKYYPNRTIPIPIEEIIDIKFNIDIVPLPGIQKVCEVDGFSSLDFSAIYIDDFIYSNREYRFRFTLAHEIGHYYMHRDKFSKIQIDPDNVIESWKKFINNLDKNDHSKLEFQGYSFGGLILAPPKELEEQFVQNIEQVTPLIEEAKANGLGRKKYMVYVIDHISYILSPIFQVSTGVISRRIQLDELEKHIE